jgi:long-chain acyl-CoA synthetase
MSNHEALKKIINDHIKNVNKDLAPFEQLKRCQILSTDWTIEGGELTPKMSLKRKVIKEKNSQIINKIFAIEEE